MTIRAAVLAALALLCACTPPARSGSPAPGVALHVEPDVVSAGDEVTLVLRNRSPGEVGYNLCSGTLERHDGPEWRAVPSERVCTMELRTLPPEGNARYSLRLAPDLAPGEYRYVTTVEALDTGARTDLRSASFRVAR